MDEMVFRAFEHTKNKAFEHTMRRFTFSSDNDGKRTEADMVTYAKDGEDSSMKKMKKG